MTFDTQPPGAADYLELHGLSVQLAEALAFGYPAGVTLPEEFQLAPEQSADALISHHPQASYFST